MHDNRDNVERERGCMALPSHVYAIGARGRSPCPEPCPLDGLQEPGRGLDGLTETKQRQEPPIELYRLDNSYNAA